jgi:hypothetical protein
MIEEFYRVTNNLNNYVFRTDKNSLKANYQIFIEAIKAFQYFSGSEQLLVILNNICLTIENLVVSNRGGLFGNWLSLQQTRISLINSSCHYSYGAGAYSAANDVVRAANMATSMSRGVVR